MKKRTKRDVITLSIIISTLIIGFVLFYFFVMKSDANVAYIYYYEESSEPIIVIDFLNEEIEIKYHQKDTDNLYPIIDLENNEIKILGYVEDDNHRTEIVFKYSFEKKSIKVVEVSCEDHTCKKVGESTGLPIICIPNRVKVEFDSGELVIVT